MASNGPYYLQQIPQSHTTFVSRPSHSDLLYNSNAMADARDSPDSLSSLQDTNGSTHIDQNALYSRLSRALTNEERHQFANGYNFTPPQQNQIDDKLLEAVTSAAGEEDSLARIGEAGLPTEMDNTSTDGDRHQKTAEQAVSLLSPTRTSENNRKRSISTSRSTSGSNGTTEGRDTHSRNLGSSSSDSGPRKRRKSEGGSVSRDQNEESEQDHSLSLFGVSESNNPSDEDSSFFVSEYPAMVSSTDGRASGIYSAAALFRKPSQASKKYTRPPMSKLFSSLDLSPEDFLRLQADAKAYMLDPEHPERKECVGNRGKGDTDMVKLKLYHCVKDFLEHNSIGDTFFGPQSASAGARSWVWPRDLNRVIALVTPLLRRMVTNERQRQYAIQTRRGDGSSANSTPQKREDAQTMKNGRSSSGPDQVDQTVSSPTKNLSNATIAAAKALSRALQEEQDVPAAQTRTLDNKVSLRVCVMRRLSASNESNRQELITSFNLPRQECEHYSLLSRLAATVSSDGAEQMAQATAASPETLERPPETQQAEMVNDEMISEHEPNLRTRKTTAETHPKELPEIFALLPSGMTAIQDEDSWLNALNETTKTVWMEGQLKVIIEV